VGDACCGVGARGEPVRFVGQTNIVVWDKAHGIEHFVRDARFATKSQDLGFIAPTPSRPTLSEASGAAFETLAALEPKPEFVPGQWGAVSDSAADIPTKGFVSVIDEADVAGYRATVLKATDSRALGEWLTKNGYAKPRFLDGWVKPYLDRGWYLTAFKVKGGDGSATGPVRMSFQTKRPFNPYSVPEENGGARASLRLYYVSAGNEVPKIGGQSAWRSAEWSAPVVEETRAALASQLKLSPDQLPINASVTTYLDSEFGQPGFDDLYFVEQSNLGATGGLGAAMLLLVALRVRRRTTERA
ncbi:DUF2330 domain-containing protein, partial [bacterium]